MIGSCFGPSVRQERASGRLLELPMPSPVWSIVAATTMCAQEKEGSPLRTVCGGSRVAENDLLMGSPLLAEDDLREEGPHFSPLRAICGGRGPGSNKPCLRSGRLTRTATTAWRCPLIHSGAGPKGHSSGRADAGATTRSSRHGLRRGPRRSPLRAICGGRGRRGARGGCRTGCPGLARSQAAMACPSWMPYRLRSRPWWRARASVENRRCKLAASG